MRVWPAALLCAVAATAQTPKEVRAEAKQGARALTALQGYLKSTDSRVREEAIKGIVEIGTSAGVDALIQATRNNDDNVQIRATDGLVNFYLPGYVPSGMTAPLKRAGSTLKARFSDGSNQMTEPYVQVRPDVVQAIAPLVRGGSSLESRANAARAIGILRGRAAEPELIAALKSKDTEVLFESIIALQKIRDESAGPRMQYLLRDLNERVQIAAIETTGILRNRAALADLQGVLQTATKSKVRRAALSAIAMLPDPASRPTFAQYLTANDDLLRAAAAEGFGRLGDPNDLKMIEQAWHDETKRTPQISLAFALVMLGETQYNENSPLRFLVQNLDVDTGRALLGEAARNPGVRLQLYGPLEQGTREQKIAIAHMLAAEGDRATEPRLEKVSHDPDPQVAEEGLRALRNLRARL